MTRDEWLSRLAAELGVAAPSADELDALLSLAGTAAHAAERQAAPISCWLVGVAGVPPTEALQLVARLAETT